MRTSAKNKLFLLALVLVGLPIITVAMIMPRINVVTALTGDENVETELYDVYFADYSEHPELDTNRFTIKILLGIKNGNDDKKLIIPRLDLDLEYLNKKVGKAWIPEEVIIDPFVDSDTDSAALVPLYVTLYVGGKDSGLAEFINGMLLGEIGAIGVDVNLYLGDIPIQVNVLLGEVLSLLAGGEEDGSSGDVDVTSLLGSLGGGDLLGGGDKLLIPDDYLFLKNSSNIMDIRALFNLPNQTLFTNQHEIFLCGAKDKFNKIHWVNATEENYAKGDGNYTWEYWDGDNWKSLSVLDGTDKFNKTGDITFSAPNDWAKKAIVDFFPQKYYYVQCKIDDLDTGIDNTLKENSTYIRMNVKKSYPCDGGDCYSPPSSSSAKIADTEEIKTMSEGLQVQADLPDYGDEDIPYEKGLLKTDLELEDYFGANGLDFNALLNDYILPPFTNGIDKALKTPWINGTADDELPSGESLEVDVLLDVVFGFLATHNIDTMDFLVSCEFDFVTIFQQIGMNFTGWLAKDGEEWNGEQWINIYDPISTTSRYSNVILFSFVLMSVLMLSLFVLGPYLAQKKVEQTKIFGDIKNLDTYMDKVRKEMEKGISKDEIDLLKTASFKTDFFEKKEKGTEGDKK